MKREHKVERILRSVYNYTVFFLLIAFVITCCMMLFVRVMSKNLGVELTGENLESAAKLTFANVMLLSLICTVIDGVRREITVRRPVKKITDAAEKIMRGDFSVRIAPPAGSDPEDPFNKIGDCFNKMAKELSGTQMLATDFIANVSHELKTPLAVIANYATMLSRPGLNDKERQEYTGVILDTSRRLADLVSNILKLNKLENQQIFPSAKRYNLSEQLCECMLGFESAWEEKKLEIETDIDEEVYVKSDAELLSVVFNNLLSNAVKFTEPGGRITLTLKTEDSFAVVRVSDTGCGISKEVGERMFDKFYQGDTSHSAQGNGLGLALVKRVVDITGSDIAVESQVGKGTTFTVKIRRADNGAA